MFFRKYDKCNKCGKELKGFLNKIPFFSKDKTNKNTVYLCHDCITKKINTQFNCKGNMPKISHHITQMEIPQY